MLKLFLKIIIAIIQIPLTIIYFLLNIIGAVLAGAGWIIGVVVFVITGVCWIFGQFDIWYQPMIGIAIAMGFIFGPTVITDIGGSVILNLKKMINSSSM